MRKEIYISVDIEADGPIPGTYSMTALGASVAGYKDREGNIVKFDPDLKENQFYAELKPISNKFNLEALKVGVYENFNKEQVIADPTGEQIRNYLTQNGETPEDAMTRFVKWVEKVKQDNEASSVVFAAFPLGFDWMFTYWYMMEYAGMSPFGHSRHIDIKTLYATKSDSQIANSVKARMKKSLHSKRKHTHKAIDDAVEQGELLMNILMWNGT